MELMGLPVLKRKSLRRRSKRGRSIWTNTYRIWKLIPQQELRLGLFSLVLQFRREKVSRVGMWASARAGLVSQCERFQLKAASISIK